MAITASFSADFTQFSGEVNKAEKELTEFEGTADKTGKALVKMGDSSSKAAAPVRSLQTSFGQFDSVLSAMGINVGPVVKGIDEIASASGKTAAQLGTLATAGLAVGAAFAGWKLGRIVADLAGTDEIIGNTVAKWLGWGDVAKETAGAVADAIAIARTRTTEDIQTIDQAIAVNNNWMKEHKKQSKEHAKEAKENAEAYKAWEAATAAITVAGQDWEAVLRRMNPEIVEASKFYLEAGVSQNTLKDAYAMTESQIKAVASALKVEQEELKKVQELEAQAAAAMKEHWDPVGEVVDQIFGREWLNKATIWVDAIETLGGSVNSLRVNELEELKQTMLDGISALARSGELTSSQTAEFVRLAHAADQALQALQPVVKVTEDLVKAQWDYVTALDEEARAQAGAAAERKKKMDAAQSGLGDRPVGGGLMPNAIVGKNGVAYDQYGRPVVAGGAISGLPIVTVNINSPLGTPDAISRAVQEAMMKSYSSGGNRLPV